jgi:hypothetical protein
MRNTARLLALSLALLPTLAGAQVYLPPGVGLPPQSVIGNPLPQTGDAVAVSFTQLRSNLNIPALKTCASSQWFNTLAIGGVLGCSQPAVSDIAGFGAGVATFLGTPTSGNLRALLPDETGTGGAVFAIGPALVNPNLGTPSAAILTNASGLPISSGVSGLGTGVATALGVNTGSAGAPVLFNGAGGTPSSLVGTNITGTAAGLTAGTASAVAVGGITGAGTGCITWLTTPSSANLRGCLIDESGTGVAYFQGGDLGTPSAGVGTNLTGLNATQLTTGTIPTARLGLGQLTNSLGGNVTLTAATTYFDGPSVAQGSTGTWFAAGNVTLADGTATPITTCKLWDGTTVIASGSVQQFSNGWFSLALSGYLATPAGNIRISCSSSTGTTNIIRAAGQDGTAKASTLSAFRIN